MTDDERQQVEQALNNIDQEAIKQLNIPHVSAPRELRFKRWIRDHPASSAVILEIAKDAYSKRYESDGSYSSVIFVDSRWKQGSMIVAHWHRDGESEQTKLSAALVPVGVANVLLTACDQQDDMTLSHALGDDAFQKAQVDLYKDLPSDGRADTSKGPSELP
ncbi:hypothetical protein BU23DRAFT_597600 [Bimuria novae-zelandiae CBS 107.79]|uniref:Uncharacterized protein n=1 Tax=Bimuria novae-zelandiae CBS 107.79 TaxID=1447943 RepID=A0A6A5VE01_9PLEO|nr:hypothetical protein BU23DRAFT_597600 [Bimuria novae-zelandiae CBS 107.79]